MLSFEREIMRIGKNSEWDKRKRNCIQIVSKRGLEWLGLMQTFVVGGCEKADSDNVDTVMLRSGYVLMYSGYLVT